MLGVRILDSNNLQDVNIYTFVNPNKWQVKRYALLIVPSVTNQPV